MQDFQLNYATFTLIKKVWCDCDDLHMINNIIHRSMDSFLTGFVGNKRKKFPLEFLSWDLFYLGDDLDQRL